jgi:hypothetical protein
MGLHTGRVGTGRKGYWAHQKGPAFHQFVSAPIIALSAEKGREEHQATKRLTEVTRPSSRIRDPHVSRNRNWYIHKAIGGDRDREFRQETSIANGALAENQLPREEVALPDCIRG